MTDHEYRIVDVFTDRPLAGNALAVFPDAASLDGATMQELARETNLSETTFVLGRDDRGHHRVRIFTPGAELPFAGHPTLGTAAVIADGAEQVVLALGVGPVAVRVASTDFGWHAELTAPPAEERPLAMAIPSLCAALRIDERDLDPSLPPSVWSCGNPFALVAVRDEAVARSGFAPSLESGGFLGAMVFSVAGPPEAARVHARVFVPGAGVPEDPATGSANAPLAARLHAAGRLALGATLVTEQGIEMKRPSRLEARVLRDEDGVVRVRVAGGVVEVGRGRFRI